MEVASAVVGITSLGIQVCQGLVCYYDSLKDYNAGIAKAYDCIDDLCKTLKLLGEALVRQGLDQARSERVEQCLSSYSSSLKKLERKLHKLQTHSVPDGPREKAWTEMQRQYYPIRESTLAKLRETVNDLREHVSLSLQPLQLDLSISSHDTLLQVGALVGDTAADVYSLLAVWQVDQFQNIVHWLSPTDPWTNHTALAMLPAFTMAGIQRTRLKRLLVSSLFGVRLMYFPPS